MITKNEVICFNVKYFCSWWP